MAKQTKETAKTKSGLPIQPVEQFKVTNCDLEQIPIEHLIYVFRGEQVILDRDIAMLYGVETRVVNQAVKRNEERFPEDFVFQLSAEETKNWKSQFVISNQDNNLKSQFATSSENDNLKSQFVTSSWGGVRKRPYAFTENGIAMLSSVLRSPTAIEANIRIMRAFTSMRHFLANNAQIFQRLSTIEYHQIETDKRIDEVFKRIDAQTSPQQGIFFDGQVFDAYRFVSDLIKKAKQSIVLIDNYVDDSVLSLLDKRESNVSAKIYTQNISPQLQLDINKHNSQYPVIEVNQFNKAHDRFLLIDDEVYHIGASIKDLGKKWFAFTLMRDITAKELIKKIK